MQQRFWKTVDADVNQIIWRDITSVRGKHMRKGIARFLASYLITTENITKLNVQGEFSGIASEASSIANQKLLEKQGYNRMFEIMHIEILDANGKRIFNCDDGTDRIVLFFKKF
uniref:Phage protein n=1 Tax=Syphacia muris TaxID=451379 RepID=A0A0N5AUV7_9BILA